MEDGPSPEEIGRQRREHKRDTRLIMWILLPIATFFFLLLVIQRFGLCGYRATMYLLRILKSRRQSGPMSIVFFAFKSARAARPGVVCDEVRN